MGIYVWKTGNAHTQARDNDAVAFTDVLTYTTGNLTRVDTSIGGVLRRRVNLSYTGDDLTGVEEILYDTDGTTVLYTNTDTISYTDGEITGIARVVT